jgi:membrane associated rhomboid family serine protease
MFWLNFGHVLISCLALTVAIRVQINTFGSEDRQEEILGLLITIGMIAGVFAGWAYLQSI